MPFDLADSLAVLERTPTVLREMLHDLPDAWTRGNEGPDTWSPYDIVGHLVHGEMTDWIPRARIVLEHGETRPFDPFDRFAQFEESKGKSLEQLLEEFAALRKRSLATLEEWSLTEEQLALTGTHPDLGRVTLSQLLATWTAHDLAHLRQIARVMARQYAVAVGPWREYMPVMSD
jgi:uncharacterized damage-inducible protein DinB